MAITELHKSFPLSISQSGASGTRMFHLDADEDRDEFAKAVLGGCYTEGSGLKRRLPLQYSANYPLMFASGVNFEGLGTSADGLANDVSYSGGWKATVYFSYIDVLLSESMEPAGEFLSIPAQGAFQWYVNGGTSGDKEIRQGDPHYINIVMAEGIWKVVRHQVPDFFPNVDETYRGYWGKINSGSFDGKDAKTLLFLPHRAWREQGADGVMRHAVELNFHYREIPWDQVYRAEDDEFQRIGRQSDPNTGPYESDGFSNLIPELDDYRKLLAGIGGNQTPGTDVSGLAAQTEYTHNAVS